MDFTNENYESLIAWLYEQFPSYQVVGDRACKLGLDNIALFDEALGRPDRLYPTIHVAGTNGKGSTSSMMAAGLAACGLKVGLFTSPHLTDFRERMKIIEADGCSMISREQVFDFFERFKDDVERIRPSFFEITTGMALDFFARREVDVAVIEVGLGGRLDATNIITPVLSVITNISLEHCQYLGYTLAEVAGEKAGIIKPGVPVVIGEALPETTPVFKEKAKINGSRILFAEEMPGQFLDLSIDEMDLQGDYQVRNIRTLSAAVSVLAGTEWAVKNLSVIQGWKEKFTEGVCHAAVRTGLRARWETLREASAATDAHPHGRARIICDTGHNAHAFRWLREQLDKMSCDFENIFFILGVVSDKDIDAIAEFLPHDVNYIFTTPSTKRARSAADLANILSDYGINGRVAAVPDEALALADSLTGDRDLIFIAGSNYLISDILAISIK